MNIKFNNKNYDLTKEKIGCFFNDEENPINNLDEDKILDIINNGRDITFTKAFYSLPCEECHDENAEKEKAYDFLEGHFYIYTKENEAVVSTIDQDAKDFDYDRLLSIGKVDNSYIVSLIICMECGTFDIEIEQLEM